MKETITIDLEKLWSKDETAKLSKKSEYINEAIKLAGKGNNIVLTGKSPVWLYMLVQHELHGITTSLTYDSPVTGKVVVYDHNPF